MILEAQEIADLNLTGLVVGVTSGCFDTIHPYHLTYLERCRAECDVLFVGVDADAMVRQFKDKDPAFHEYARVRMVAALKVVTGAFILRNLGQFEVACVKAIKVFKNHPELYGKPIIGAGPDNCKLVVIPDIEELTSTTQIHERIRAQAKQP